jgi:hypothetical protein
MVTPFSNKSRFRGTQSKKALIEIEPRHEKRKGDKRWQQIVRISKPTGLEVFRVGFRAVVPIY